MQVKNVKFSDNWQEVKDACMVTINKEKGKYPTNEWKKKILLCEHSPIRKIRVSWKWIALKYWVSVHFARHKFGIEHWIGTQRNSEARDEFPQGAIVVHACEANAQALINISRKRLCNRAAKETKEAWEAVKMEIQKEEPVLAQCMVRECVYRGFCPELHSCGYCFTKEYDEEVRKYREI